MTNERLTDEELVQIMAGRKFSVGHDYAPEIERLVAEVKRLRMPPALTEYWEHDALDKLNPGTEAGLRMAKSLIAEVRRLRSDDWLQRAAEETVATEDVDDSRLGIGSIVAILRKHRDGAP